MTNTNFAKLKKDSNTLSKLADAVTKINNKGNASDGTYWKLERDKAGNGSAIIRFLPAPPVDGDEGLPWVRYFDHGFKGPTGKWYIEKSLTTLNQADPVSEYNSELWNSTEDDKSPAREQARKQKRRLHYVSNILVVDDPKNPTNNGKVFRFVYGKKIFDKISLLMSPEFEGDIPVNPFDFWTGANFKLRCRVVDDYPNFDQSTFEPSSPIFKDDKKIEELWKSLPSLTELVAPSLFKSYDELKKQLEAVLATPKGISRNMTNSAASTNISEDKSEKDSIPFNMNSGGDDSSGDDDDLEFFKNLAK